MSSNQNRRDFIKNTSAAMAIPYFISPSAIGLGGNVAPSDRIVMGAIGCGGKGRNNTRAFLGDKRVHVAAACDVDQKHLTLAVDLVNEKNGNTDCQAFGDFREMLAMPELDVVHVSTPDHWHAVAAVGAMEKGKDVYCEKPLANSFGESKAVRDSALATGRILQCGSHERSNSNCRFGAELVRNGRIGKLQTVRIQMPCEQKHHLQAKGTVVIPEPQEVPEGLNWDMWQGPTSPRKFHPDACHFWWRFVLDYGGGEMTDRGAHIIDIAQLAMDQDDSGPVEYSAKGMQVAGSPYNAFWDYEFTNTYADGVKMIGSTQGPRGVKFEGTDGWIFIAIHGGKLSASNPQWLPEHVRAGKPVGIDDQLPEDFEVKLGRSPGHHKNFIDCVVSRENPMATAEIGHRTATICHLNNIAMRVGRTLKWDPKLEELTDDAEAGEYLMPRMREPWKV